MTPWASACASRTRARSNSNATAFDFICVHTERRRCVSAPLLMSLSILILPSDAFLFTHGQFPSENFCGASLTLPNGDQMKFC